MINIFLEHIYEAVSQTGASLESILKKANAMGIDGLECDRWRLTSETKQLFNDSGFKTASVYEGFDFGHEPFNVSEKKYKTLLETAADFGAKKVLAIPGFVFENDSRDDIIKKSCEILNHMCQAAKQYGITVTLEDYDDKLAPYSTISELEYFMKNVDGLRFTFDTGNFAYSLENAAEAFERLKSYIVHVHLKDRSFENSRADDKNSNAKADLAGKIMYPCEVGGGYIGISDLIEKLKAENYSGDYSIEHFGAKNQLEYMKKSVMNINNYLK